MASRVGSLKSGLSVLLCGTPSQGMPACRAPHASQQPAGRGYQGGCVAAWCDWRTHAACDMGRCCLLVQVEGELSTYTELGEGFQDVVRDYSDTIVSDTGGMRTTKAVPTLSALHGAGVAVSGSSAASACLHAAIVQHSFELTWNWFVVNKGGTGRSFGSRKQIPAGLVFQ